MTKKEIEQIKKIIIEQLTDFAVEVDKLVSSEIKKALEKDKKIITYGVIDVPYGSFISIGGELYQKLKNAAGDQNYLLKSKEICSMEYSTRNDNDWEKSDILNTLRGWGLKNNEIIEGDFSLKEFSTEFGVSIISKEEYKLNKGWIWLDTTDEVWRWTRSPHSTNATHVWYLYGDSSYSLSNNDANLSYGVSPTLWLSSEKSDQSFSSGEGTKDDPYILET